MKTKIVIITAMIAAGALVYAAEVKQAPIKTVTQQAVIWERGTGHPNPNGQHRNFVDENKDGICDTFVDSNKDGKCDNFVDNNKDGFNDNPRHMGRNGGDGMRKGRGAGRGR